MSIVIWLVDKEIREWSEREMRKMEERIAEVSSYLQDLKDSEVFPEVQDAVAAKDKNALVRICRKDKIPEIYIGVIVSVLLAIGPTQKWPLQF